MSWGCWGGHDQDPGLAWCDPEDWVWWPLHTAGAPQDVSRTSYLHETCPRVRAQPQVSAVTEQSQTWKVIAQSLPRGRPQAAGHWPPPSAQGSGWGRAEPAGERESGACLKSF